MAQIDCEDQPDTNREGCQVYAAGRHRLPTSLNMGGGFLISLSAAWRSSLRVFSPPSCPAVITARTNLSPTGPSPAVFPFSIRERCSGVIRSSAANRFAANPAFFRRNRISFPRRAPDFCTSPRAITRCSSPRRGMTGTSTLHFVHLRTTIPTRETSLSPLSVYEYGSLTEARRHSISAPHSHFNAGALSCRRPT